MARVVAELTATVLLVTFIVNPAMEAVFIFAVELATVARATPLFAITTPLLAVELARTATARAEAIFPIRTFIVLVSLRFNSATKAFV